MTVAIGLFTRSSSDRSVLVTEISTIGGEWPNPLEIVAPSGNSSSFFIERVERDRENEVVAVHYAPYKRECPFKRVVIFND